MEHTLLNLYLTLLGNLDRVIQRLRDIGKQGAHLLFALDIEFVRLEQPAAVRQRTPHLQAHQNVLRPGVLLFHIVAVVGRDKRNVQFPRQRDEQRVDAPLLRQAVVLYLDIEIPTEHAL